MNFYGEGVVRDMFLSCLVACIIGVEMENDLLFFLTNLVALSVNWIIVGLVVSATGINFIIIAARVKETF